jgi:hypothetical protein
VDVASVLEFAVVFAGVVVGRVEVALSDVVVPAVDAARCNSMSIGFQCSSKRSLNLWQLSISQDRRRSGVKPYLTAICSCRPGGIFVYQLRRLLLCPTPNALAS